MIIWKRNNRIYKNICIKYYNLSIKKKSIKDPWNQSSIKSLILYNLYITSIIKDKKYILSKNIQYDIITYTNDIVIYTSNQF